MIIWWLFGTAAAWFLWSRAINHPRERTYAAPLAMIYTIGLLLNLARILFWKHN